ncbi:MAG: EutN/CcmL family microcompartment protein [Pseudomonadota bacterium]
MRIARVTGTVTASVKPTALTAVPLVVVDIEDGAGAVVASGVVAADVVGAGPGELVLLAEGSAARLPASLASAPVDAVVMAIVDSITLSDASATTARRSSTQTRKS